MSAVQSSEVFPGLVVHLDPAALKAHGGCETNAQTDHRGDRTVRDEHYFLILEMDPKSSMCVAVPLFSGVAFGSELLEEDEKDGFPDKWLGEDSYFSRWQHWRIPVAAIPSASARDESEPASRRTYALQKPAMLRTISDWQHKNRCAFRPV